MTKEAYLEMCADLGTEPLESEMPVEFEDLYQEVQETIPVYNSLQDNWDSMAGVYLGKSKAGLIDTMVLMGVSDLDEQKLVFKILKIIDYHRSNLIASKKPKSTP